MPRRRATVVRRLGRHHGHLAEVDEEAEVLLGKGRGVGDGILRGERPVGFDGERQPVVVGALPHASLGHGEVGATDRVVDRVDPHDVHRQRPVDGVLLGLDVPSALVDVQLPGDLAVVLQREQQLVGIHDRHRAVLLDVARVDRPRAVALNVQDRLVYLRGEHQRQLLQPLNDLMHVLDDRGDRLVLVDHAVETEGPHGGAPQRREQHAAQRVAESVPVAPLERLEAELGGVGVVFPLGHLDQVRTNQPGQIKSRDHLE